jgi:hypothetical protein
MDKNRILSFDEFIAKNEPAPQAPPAMDMTPPIDAMGPVGTDTVMMHGEPEPMSHDNMPSMNTGDFPMDPAAEPVVPQLPMHSEEEPNLQKLEEPNAPTQQITEAVRRYARVIR